MSALKFFNQTPHIAQYQVYRGDMRVARLPGIAPGASLVVPVYNDCIVTASTWLQGNLYTSAPLRVNKAARFLAQVRQDAARGTYDFEVRVLPSSSTTQMQFEKTCEAPVSFSLSHPMAPAQLLRVEDAFTLRTLNVAEQFSVTAVINGVTTDELCTADPDAVITAVSSSSDGQAPYCTLQLGH
jgi:hypothetical protein